MLDDAAEGRESGEDAAPVARTFLITGLGNPGSRYERTPHNMGFLIIDELARRHQIRVTRKEGPLLTGTGQIRGIKVLLVKPQTFMNNTGPGLKSVMKSHNFTTRDLVLIHDELDLPFSGLRIRRKGSAAGHNGVKSVIAALKSDGFTRVRVGIRPEGEVRDTALYVLAPFGPGMKESLDEVICYSADAIESIIAEGVLKAMTQFNRRAQGLKEEEE